MGTSESNRGFVSIVGAGPWDPGLITVAGVRRLQRAQVVVADYLANPNLLLHVPPDALIIQRTTGPHGMPLRQAAVNDLLVEHAQNGRYVVRLKGGDPCMFGRGGEEAQVLREAGIDYEFVPGVSSPIAAPEVAGIPVTHRDFTPAVTFVSGYEAYDKAGLHVAWEHLARSAGTLVLMMSVKNARANAARLVEAGRAATTPAAVVRWGTRGISTVVEGTLETIADRMDAAGIRAPSVLVVGDVVSLREQIAWVDRRPLFGRRILVTRPRDSAGPLLDQLTDRGADAVALPCLQVDPPLDQLALDRAVASIRDHDGLILSSRAGVDAFFDALQRVDLDARALAARSVLAVGTTTAKACRRRGITPDIIPEAPRSEGIVAALRSHGKLASSWLHVRAEHGRATVRDAIEAAGGQYALAVGYRTSQPTAPAGVVASLGDPSQRGEGLDAICLYSGRSGEHLQAMLEAELGAAQAQDLLERTPVVTVGPVTAEALRRRGISVEAVANDPSDGAVIDALIEIFSTG